MTEFAPSRGANERDGRPPRTAGEWDSAFGKACEARRAGRFDEAARSLEGLADEPDISAVQALAAHLMLGAARQDLGDLVGAIREWRVAALIRPKHRLVSRLIVVALLDLDRADEANEEMRRLIAARDGDRSAFQEMIDEWIERGDLDPATLRWIDPLVIPAPGAFDPPTDAGDE